MKARKNEQKFIVYCSEVSLGSQLADLDLEQLMKSGGLTICGSIKADYVSYECRQDIVVYKCNCGPNCQTIEKQKTCESNSVPAPEYNYLCSACKEGTGDDSAVKDINGLWIGCPCIETINGVEYGTTNVFFDTATLCQIK